MQMIGKPNALRTCQCQVANGPVSSPTRTANGAFSLMMAAIAAGETRTGVTVMRMEAGLDTGPILLQEAIAIGPTETAGELAPRLAELGARLMLAALDRLDRGDLPEQPQDGAFATYAPRLTRESSRVDWQLPAARIADRLRAWTPWPGTTLSDFS